MAPRLPGPSNSPQFRSIPCGTSKQPPRWKSLCEASLPMTAPAACDGTWSRLALGASSNRATFRESSSNLHMDVSRHHFSSKSKAALFGPSITRTNSITTCWWQHRTWPLRSDSPIYACRPMTWGTAAKPPTYIHTYIHACRQACVHACRQAGTQACMHAGMQACRHACMPTLHSITLHYITLHYSRLHDTTLHYTTLHYITLHYITLHYITLHYIHTHT